MCANLRFFRGIGWGFQFFTRNLRFFHVFENRICANWNMSGQAGSFNRNGGVVLILRLKFYASSKFEVEVF